MNAQVARPPMLLVNQEGGQILIHGILRRTNTKAGEPFKVYLNPGEAYGGHSFAEWQQVATGNGYTYADWLEN